MHHAARHKSAVVARFSDTDSALKWRDMYDLDTRRLDAVNFRRRRDFAVEQVLRLLPPGGVVLDVGCGSAPVLAELRRHGVHCIGLEYAPDMLKHAVERLESAGVDATGLYRGDCVRLPFVDGAFDIVVCLGVISYVEHIPDVLAEIRRVLKPGGRTLISYRNRFNPILWDPAGLVKLAVGRLPPAPRKIGRAIDHREFQAEMQSAGFELEGHTGIGFGPIRMRGRPILPEAASIRLSDLLGRLAEPWAAPSRWLADISVWTYRR